MSRVTVNGQSFDVPDGAQVVVRGNAVSVSGRVLAANLSGVVRVEWQGSLATLQSDASVTCGDVAGGVDAGGSVQCRDVRGSVSAGGSVQCGAVGGAVRAGGSVSHR